jgi:hypothetical protein
VPSARDPGFGSEHRDAAGPRSHHHDHAAISESRLRWHGHRLDVVAVELARSVVAGHAIAPEVGHALMLALPNRVSPLVRIDPNGRGDSHLLTSHHDDDGPHAVVVARG